MRSAPPRAFLFDLDGTLYSGGSAIPGAADTLRRLRKAGVPYRLVTNTTSRPRSALVQRLAGYGFEVSPREIFTAVLAGAELAEARGVKRIAPFLPAPALEDGAVDGVRKLDETCLEPRLTSFPRQIEGVYRDAVPTQAGPG